ncbi:ABC transporter permease [Acidisoma cladoniae]|jgi:ribose transport system permease protein|uniref:ABC transporter permease n=1 Tax=Acidisoma cladoniae TaxID=3040935 RepID=UPI00254ED91B|nr:ABC transporter permease [Acidisoma sp. PAMC 29798]
MSATVNRRRLPVVGQLLGNGTAMVIAIYVLLLIIYALSQNDALSMTQFSDQLNNGLPLALAAAGGTLVVLMRGFDLSVAGVIALTDVLTATQATDGPMGALVMMLIVVGVGLLVGAVNGFLVAYVGLQSIACTLATMIVCSGAALLILDAPGGDVPEFISDNLTGSVGGIPVPLIIVLVVLCGWAALKRTNWGVGLYAVGADETAAQLAGVRVRRVKFLAYCLAGGLYGLAGMMLTAVTSNGDPGAGTSYLLLVFAAIAIGGTTFTGGRGGLLGSMIGAATLMLLQKVLFSVGVSSFFTGIGQGLIMIAAVLIAASSARISRRMAA